MADFSASNRRQLASKGEARPDGSYPIRNPQDVENAVKDWVRTGRNGAVKAWIIKRARALGVAVPDALTGGNDGDEMTVARKFMK